jgi:hypothetical protein
LAFCFALSALIFVLVEIEKWLMRNGFIYAALPSGHASDRSTANSSE